VGQGFAEQQAVEEPGEIRWGQRAQ
jgi:hypothetical protein